VIIEVDGRDVVQNLELMEEVARKLRFQKIAISIDDLGAEWPSLVGLHNFPFVELKVDSNFIAGVADDGFKQAVCNKILGLANSYGARVVAEGVETRADFFAVREMGFELVQGFLFAKPMPAEKLPYQMHGRPLALPQ
jgi:EAL domain-containing protein (putative c-di-GMP-specific phosphodiesterase class I)